MLPEGTEDLIERALREDIGWLYALVLEDFDQAADAFAAATAGAADPAPVDPAKLLPQLADTAELVEARKKLAALSAA